MGRDPKIDRSFEKKKTRLPSAISLDTLPGEGILSKSVLDKA